LTVEFLSPSEAGAAGAEWRGLERAVGAGLTNSWDWVESWLHHYGDLIPHHFAIAGGARGVRGVALLTHGVGQTRGPIPVRTLHLGTAGEPPSDTVWVEYNRPLVAPDDRSAFAAALLRSVRSARLPWDILELDGFEPEEAEPLLRLDRGFEVSRKVCHVADLRSMRDGGNPFAGFRRETIAKIRKNRRRFEEHFGPIATQWAESIDDARAIFAELIPLHQQRWQRVGEAGCFASARFTGFHRELIERLLPKGQIVLYRVAVGEQLIGIFYGFIERGTLYHYQWGLARFEQNSLSPGFVVGALCIEEAIAKGLDELNWLAGDVRYKRELANAQRELIWAELHRGPRMVAIDAMRKARAWQRRRRAGPEPETREDER
jgi:CelD/BcsL family acetyltransferase involved in cellulose biosynthesis